MRAPLRDALLVAATAAVTMVVFAAPIVVQRLSTDYSDRFAAYGAETFGDRIATVVTHYGIVGLCLTAGSAFLLLGSRQTRRPAAVLILHMVVNFVLMTSIQDHSPQHWYLYDAQILLLVGLGVDRVLRLVEGRRRAVAVAGLWMLGAVATASTYLPVERLGLDPGAAFADPIRPAVRQDVDEIDRLLTYLDRRCEIGAGPVYVLASSGLLSDQVLSFANLSLGTEHPSVRQVLTASHVDRRDGFPIGLLVASTVVVAEPVQVHLRPADQQVVVAPAHSFLDGTDVARAFARLYPTFELEGGVVVSVFDRQRRNTPDEIEGLSAKLRSRYPGRPEIFSP